MPKIATLDLSNLSHVELSGENIPFKVDMGGPMEEEISLDGDGISFFPSSCDGHYELTWKSSLESSLRSPTKYLSEQYPQLKTST